MAPASHPTLINIPPPGSNPETPSEIPGTPTSATTSLSALSTTAIKDGHRGNVPQGPLGSRHSHSPSTTSLEAERADRISRLAGLERVSTLRAPLGNQSQSHHNLYTQPGPSDSYQAGFPVGGGTGGSGGREGGGGGGGGPGGPGGPGGAAGASTSPQTTPTSTSGFFSQHNNLTPAYFDQNGQPFAVTKLSTVGSASATESHLGDGSRTTGGERDEDLLSTDTNYREAADSVTSMPDAMDEDNYNDIDGARSTGGYDDRMSDDGSASLVGFGEGAGSTVSGPIYQRRPVSSNLVAAAAAAASASSSSGAPGYSTQAQAWSLERTNSGMSDVRRERELMTMTSSDAPASFPVSQEGRDTRMTDGHLADRGPEVFDTSAARGFQGREAAERIMQRLDHGESKVEGMTLGGGSSSKGAESLGKFYFEEKENQNRH